MKSHWKDHPCFSPEARHTSARIHLPVAPRCNVQCRFCDRKFDCTNESRPGVTSRVLSPEEALDYLARIQSRLPQLAVVGIAGPGDPLANAGETLETLRLVRAAYPKLRLCLATNGLELPEYASELADLHVSHVTVTVNAVDPVIGSLIYAWVRVGRRSLGHEEGAGLLLERQINGIALLKAKGVTVKVNTLILPDINDAHIPKVASHMKALGVDLMNCMPLQLNDQAVARGWREPTQAEIERAKQGAETFLPGMHHCTRCRADAAGFLGEDLGPELLARWAEDDAAPARCCSSTHTDQAIPKPAHAASEAPSEESRRGASVDASGAACRCPPPRSRALAPAPDSGNRPRMSDPGRPYIAVASREGFLVSAHLGEVRTLRIYKLGPSGPKFLEERPTPDAGGGTARWTAMAEILKDCSALVVNGIGGSPRAVLEGFGLRIFVLEGLISEALGTLFAGQEPSHFEKRRAFACGESCAGAGTGCGA